MKKILIVVANYYPEISVELIKSASKLLKDYNVSKISAPGVYEIPVLISRNINNFDGFVALGCVIKGETPHFELICNSVTSGIINLSINSKKPIGNGILTCFNKDQAMARLNKGAEAAEAVKQVLNNVTIK
jgi:6,7-dimethyl-8-ribityllumazine synthase